ncbi:MAG: TlpA disulfide reductase family protein [Planctomycetota bacterium]|nr:TlpA disulfide reductase family protein [Planctomycetota bacterium]
MTCAIIQCRHLTSALRCAIGFALSLVFISSPSASAQERASQQVLHLANDGILPGSILDSAQSGQIRWKSPLFTHPFEFPLSSISMAQFPTRVPRPEPGGEYCLELTEGDVLYGDISELSDASLSVTTAHAGTVHINRSDVQRIYRWKETSLIYLGPGGLDDWSQTLNGEASTDAWSSDGGWPRTASPNASLFGTFSIPARSAIEFELSWNDLPDFEFVLGADSGLDVSGLPIGNARATKTDDAFRFEVWDDTVVVMGESERDADVAEVTPVVSGPGGVRVQLYLDQEKQRLSIYSSNGQQKASLKLHSRIPKTRGSLRLSNRKGDIRLTHLRIANWDGILPRKVQTDKSRIHQTDGTIVYGQITGFDPAARAFTLLNDGSTIEVNAATVSDVFLSPIPTAPIATDSTPDTADPLPDTSEPVDFSKVVRIAYLDGSRFSGTFNGIEQGHVLLSCPSIREPLKLPLDGLRSIGQQLSKSKVEFKATAAGLAGRLEIDGLKLPGRLVDGAEQPDGSCLVWHPDYSVNSSPLAKNLAGRIVYRDPPKPVVKSTVGVQQGNGVAIRINQRKPAIQGFGEVFKQLLTGPLPPTQRPRVKAAQTLHLRSGDTIPCDVVSVDEDGLHFTTPLSSATFIAHDRIKGVELAGRTGSPTLDATKRERLLTLPRLQKGSPPTHLIYSSNGDFLRGRLIAMNEHALTVEVRLSNREIPRERVSQVIWLHSDELTPVEKQQPEDIADSTPGDSAGTEGTAETVSVVPKPEVSAVVASANDNKHQPEPVSTDATRVQTVIRNSDRLTFLATRLTGSTLSGSSDILGDCQADLSEIDQLLFGNYIEQAAAQLAYHRWKLHYAMEPKFVLAGSDGSGGGVMSGTDSPLVGQAAPDFNLAQLTGDDFRLSDHRGEIIVLDFWATWCSPCLQTMPLVDEVVEDFADHKVRLLAVNMEEQPAEIKSTLERHKLDVPVVLDMDGVAAARYSVTSIPQTVVIDREGNVARLFVGGGPKLAGPLRKALEELTGTVPESAKETAN